MATRRTSSAIPVSVGYDSDIHRWRVHYPDYPGHGFATSSFTSIDAEARRDLVEITNTTPSRLRVAVVVDIHADGVDVGAALEQLSELRAAARTYDDRRVHAARSAIARLDTLPSSDRVSDRAIGELINYSRQRVEQMRRDIPAPTEVVSVSSPLDPPVRAAFRKLTRARQSLTETDAQIAALVRRIIAALDTLGMYDIQIGDLVGLSRQRIPQIRAERPV